MKAGVLEGKNLVLAVPTASGKTMVAEICALKHVMERGGKVLYLVPLKALATEKYEEFQKFTKIGIKVILSTGDFDYVDPTLGRHDIIIATNEKADSIFRHRPSWVNALSLIVADEIHLLGDGSRGPTLEVLLTGFRLLNPKAQILALSATISNADDIAEWLGSTPITSDWRPVPLLEGVYFQKSVVFRDGQHKKIEGTETDPVALLAVDVIRSGGQMLVFTGSRLSATSLAKRIAEPVRKQLKRSEERKLMDLSSKILKMGERTRISDRLARAVANGVAFHHAGLTYEQRRAVEDAFRSFLIKCVCATPTLCLPEGEEIFCNGHPQRIESLSSTQRVLTHNGRFRNVIAPLQRSYRGELLEICAYGQLPMRMTPEHKVLRVTRGRRSIHTSTRSEHWWAYSSPEWVEAKHLKKGDLVLFPRIKDEVDLTTIKLQPPGPLANQFGVVGTHWTRLKFNQIPLTAETLELMGLYIAEGYTGKNGTIMFALNIKEEHLTKKIVDTLSSWGLRCTVKDFDRNRRVIRSCSMQLVKKLRELFGTNSYNKHLPSDFILLPKEKLVHLVRGMWMGDGWVYETRTGPVASYSTISSTLAKQLFAILVKLGFMPSISKCRRAGQIKKESTRGIVHKHDLYQIKLSGKQLERFGKLILMKDLKLKGNRNYNINCINDNYYCMVIREIRSLYYEGTVYNLEVDGDSSYTSSFVVHNSAGVNLPARRVLIYDYRRYEAGVGQTNIPVLEEKQMAGRAGRPKYDSQGEAILLARSEAERDFLLEEYVLAKPEKVWSKLGAASSLRSHILATITMGLAHSQEDVFDFLEKSFCAYQYGINSFRSAVLESLEMLTSEGMVKSDERKLIPTALGRRIAELYIDPKSAVILRNGLKIRRSGIPPISYLTLICHTPDMPKLYVRRRELDVLKAFFEANSDLLLYDLPEEEGLEYEMLLEEIKTALLLKDWIEESPEDGIVERFDVGSGDIYSYVESAKWLVYAAHELAKLLHYEEALAPLLNLSIRVENGVKEELLPLISLRGVGRIRARALFSAGFRTIDDLKRASPTELNRIPTIGTETIRSIKEQVGGTVSKEEWSMVKSKRGTKQLSIKDYE